MAKIALIKAHVNQEQMKKQKRNPEGAFQNIRIRQDSIDHLVNNQSEFYEHSKKAVIQDYLETSRVGFRLLHP
jgi:hypothetical protein